jgi:phenylacetate-coenzyme A ligase PaaK-like adenylate-forming protein
VPLYASGKAERPPESATAESVSAWLATLPTVGERELRRGFPRSLVRKSQDLKAAMADGTVEIIATSGTTENRLQVLWEWSWWDPQEREAMRLNRRVAEAMPEDRSNFRELVLTTPVCGGATCHIGNLSRQERTIDGMLFLNQVADPSHWNASELDRMVGEWNELRPEGVEADPAYLAALCHHAREHNTRLHAPAFIDVTYELTTRAHLRAIAQAIGETPVYSLYGATETGVLFMECSEGRLHHNGRHSHVELLDLGGGLGQVVMTTLGRAWMPLVRYELGDVVRVAAEQKCRCGLDGGGYLLERIEGRRGDCIERSGRLITPAMIDDAIDQAAPAVRGWQLACESENLLRLVLAPDAPADAGERAATAVAHLLDAKVTAIREVALLPEGSGKYRLVRP